MSVAISIRYAIINTDLALRQRLPAIATIHVDEQALQEERELHDEWIYFEYVTPTLIREIGSLPYVRAFDYTTWGHHFFSDTLIRAFNADLFADSFPGSDIDSGSFAIREGVSFEQFTLKGIQNPHVVDIEAGLIHLASGRVFTEDEVENGAHVTLVSQAFLEANGLALGQNVVLEYRIYDEFSDHENPLDHLMGTKVFELEIIGVFDHALPENAFSLEEIHEHIELINRLYVPNQTIEAILPLYFDTLLETHPEMLEHLMGEGELEDMLRYEQIIFLLNDPLDLESFRTAVNRRLPEFWTTSDLSNAYADMSTSMAMMQEIANALAISAFVATVLTLGMLILIYIKDRKLEIGVYLALGEKKNKIVGQVMIELLVVTTLALTFALFIGNVVATQVSMQMIQTDLVRQSNEERITVTLADTPEALGFRHEMTHEEMFELYDTSLNLSTVLVFYGTTFAIIAISIIPPIYYLVKLQPKNVLIKGAIG